MFVRASRVRVGLVCMLLLLAPTRAAADSPLRFQAGTTTGQIDDVTDTPGFALGGALALSRWSPSSSLIVVPQLELLFARRHAPFALDGTRSASHAMDFLDLPLVLRAELTIRGRSVYALAGAYGGILLQAQRTRPDGVVDVDRGSLASRVDLGLLAGGGFELASFAWGELLLEARYQRGSRSLSLGRDQPQEALSLLLGYELGSETSEGPSWAHDRRLAVKSGPVVTRFPSSEYASYSPGISLGGAFSPARIGSRAALVPQLELAFVHRRAHAEDGRIARWRSTPLIYRCSCAASSPAAKPPSMGLAACTAAPCCARSAPMRASSPTHATQ